MKIGDQVGNEKEQRKGKESEFHKEKCQDF